MKNQITMTALFLLLATGAFATVPGKKAAVTSSSEVAIKGLDSSIGVSISVAQDLASRPLVTILDDAHNILYKGSLSGVGGTGKSFNLAGLETGDYVISVDWNNQELKKVVHIFEEEVQKRYVIN